jgi:hypothetical protein
MAQKTWMWYRKEQVLSLVETEHWFFNSVTKLTKTSPFQQPKAATYHNTSLYKDSHAKLRTK